MSYTITLYPDAETTNWSQLNETLLAIAMTYQCQGIEEWSIDTNDRVLAISDEFIDLSPNTIQPQTYYFADQNKAEEFLQATKSLATDLQWGEVKKLADKNWHEAWQKYYKPQKIGGILIHPEWHKTSQKNVVYINPGQAFGAGTHPTTQLCIQLLQAIKTDISTVLDFGAGTGILALAAKQWFKQPELTCVEIEQPARELIQHNLKINQTSATIAETIPNTTYQLCFANILLPVLKAKAIDISTAVTSNGYLILSGILKEEINELQTSYSNGFTVLQTIQSGDWAAMLLQKDKDILVAN